MARAIQLGQEGLLRYWQIGDRLGVAETLERLAEIEGKRHRHIRVIHLLSAASALRPLASCSVRRQ
jgi:hypothetical protein